MPYFITESHPECKSGWAVVDDGDGYYGCHTTKQSAIDQAIAISLSDDEPFEGERAAIDSLVIGDYVSWNPVDPEILAEIVAVEGQMAVVRIYDSEDGVFTSTDKLMIINIFKLEKIVRPELVAEEFEEVEQVEPTPLERAESLIARIEAKQESEPMTEVNDTRAKWTTVAWSIKAKIEGLPNEARSIGKVETRTNHMELRAVGDGMTFEGYAAVFNSPSEPLPFTEIVKPGAFKRSLQSRNRMMLLWNHDTSNPLASTRNGSLKLTEDNVGLKVIATLPDTTLGRDISTLVRTGVIDSMSFGFAVKKDSWTSDGATRYLEDVSLFEVSLVSTPAYGGTAGSVSVRDINPDQLADALLKLESGEELELTDANLIKDVVTKLQKTEEVEEVQGDILALKQKKLALLLKEVQDA